MGAENVVGCDPAATEPTKDNRDPQRLTTEFLRRYAVTHLPGSQFFEMRAERVAHFGARLKPVLRLVFDSANQQVFHLGRELGIYLARPRVLGEIEDQQRVVLRIRSGEQVKHGCAKAVDVNPWIGLPAEQLGRGV